MRNVDVIKILKGVFGLWVALNYGYLVLAIIGLDLFCTSVPFTTLLLTAISSVVCAAGTVGLCMPTITALFTNATIGTFFTGLFAGAFYFVGALIFLPIFFKGLDWFDEGTGELGFRLYLKRRIIDLGGKVKIQLGLKGIKLPEWVKGGE